jgi:4-diphosphocytidyl-2-C-methyl-D-erythritol kinase
MKASETLRAPAKLNLTLEVLSRRLDGYHGIRSVMVPIDLCDELRIEPAERFAFSCDMPELQEHNIVQRAVHALPLPNSNFRISLRKQIPTGAGMGGGSSDAASVLLAAQRGTFGSAISAEYLAIARSLGSDVPFFLVETAALVEGTGERVTALGPVPPWHVLIVQPPVAVSTAWAYERIDATPQPSRPRSDSVSLRMAEALQRADFNGVAALLQNDFEVVIAPATPEIARALDLLRGAGAAHALMTGSGSCVFALFETREQRDSVAGGLQLPQGYRTYMAALWNGEAWRNAA